MGPYARGMWSIKTGGLSWQWSLKTGFTVFHMVYVIVILNMLIIARNLKIKHFMFNIYKHVRDVDAWHEAA